MALAQHGANIGPWGYSVCAWSSLIPTMGTRTIVITTNNCAASSSSTSTPSFLPASISTSAAPLPSSTPFTLPLISTTTSSPLNTVITLTAVFPSPPSGVNVTASILSGLTKHGGTTTTFTLHETTTEAVTFPPTGAPSNSTFHMVDHFLRAAPEPSYTTSASHETETAPPRCKLDFSAPSCPGPFGLATLIVIPVVFLMIIAGFFGHLKSKRLRTTAEAQGLNTEGDDLKELSGSAKV